MSLSEVFEREGGVGRGLGDEELGLSRTASTVAALGVVMLILPTLAAFQDGAAFAAYYLHPAIASVWGAGLVLDALVVLSLLERRLADRRWLGLTIVALLALSALPFVELSLATRVVSAAVPADLPLPWATTHLGPVGSVTALVAAGLCLRALAREGGARA